ncbi:hypothetical protein FIBSPDRAFT_853768 [Athelia psychrophila]|uniref:Uncharacterized protein n=1 Tax=Athelia psychrophila TaxID=1759441 RepID=A0A166QHB1_9AGAM|nr:hypothetical protein FIBSPDRAFT_853768 [Fibularhizoctonia sp. CBS 109695]
MKSQGTVRFTETQSSQSDPSLSPSRHPDPALHRQRSLRPRAKQPFERYQYPATADVAFGDEPTGVRHHHSCLSRRRG